VNGADEMASRMVRRTSTGRENRAVEVDMDEVKT